MSDLPDFLGGEPAPEPQPAPAPEPIPAPEPAPAASEPAASGPARGPDGKFAPAEPTPAPVGEAAPAASADAGHVVPLATFLDLRDKANAAEKRAADLEKWRADQEAKLRQPVPDRNTDPEAYREHVDATTRQTLDLIALEQRREISRIRAEQAHGKDAVDAAFEWAAKRIDDEIAAGQPSYLNQQVRRHADPIGFIMGEWRKEQVASKVDPNDYDAFLAWKAGQGAQPGNPTPAPTLAPPPRPVAPRPSLAAGPSAGAHAEAVPKGGEETFNAMFGT